MITYLAIMSNMSVDPASSPHLRAHTSASPRDRGLSREPYTDWPTTKCGHAAGGLCQRSS